MTAFATIFETKLTNVLHKLHAKRIAGEFKLITLL
jgi:hypothetical protein